MNSDEQFVSIVALLVANLKMNYQIMECLIKKDAKPLSDWYKYIEDMDKEVINMSEQIKEQKNDI